MGEVGKLVIVIMFIWVTSIVINKVMDYKHKKSLEEIQRTHTSNIELIHKDYFDKLSVYNEENSKAIEIIQEKYQQLYHEAFSGTIRNAVLNVIEQHENGVDEPFIDITYTHKKVEYQLRLELK